MKDIAPELLAALQAAFEKKLAALPNIRDGTSYLDVERYAVQVGEALAAVFGENLSANLLPDGRMYYNIADRVLRPLLEQDHRLVAQTAAEMLNKLNDAEGIGLKAQPAPINTDRIDGIVDRVADAERFEDAAWLLDEPVVNFSQAAAADTLKRNVDFMGQAGLRPRIIRTATGQCCPWCQTLAGSYRYPDTPRDVYRKHERCRCTVDYDPGGAKKFQNVHSKEWKTAEERAKIEARKQVGVLSSDGRRYAEDIIIGRSVGAKAKNYDILDPNTGEYFHFAEGTRIQNIEVFAGFGVKKPLNEEVALGLSKQIGGDPEKWQHCKGFGIIDYDGEERPAEVHWFQEESVGRDKFKVKRWLDEG